MFFSAFNNFIVLQKTNVHSITAGRKEDWYIKVGNLEFWWIPPYKGWMWLCYEKHNVGPPLPRMPGGIWLILTRYRTVLDVGGPLTAYKKHSLRWMIE